MRLQDHDNFHHIEQLASVLGLEGHQFEQLMIRWTRRLTKEEQLVAYFVRSKTKGWSRSTEEKLSLF